MTRRLLCCVLLCASVPCAGPVSARPQERNFERLDQVDWEGWEDLTGLLQDVHARTGVPAVAAAVVRAGQVLDVATVGVASFGSDEAVASDAAFHLGSVTKSFTAVVIAKLVEDEVLAWDTRVDEVLEGVEMRAEYRAVTLEMLLQHRSGLAAYTDERPAGHPADRQYAGSPLEQRAAFLADALMQPAAGIPGETELYSNAGVALAGHMAELAAGESWEALVRHLVFEPLGMESAGLGIPASPLGHVPEGAGFVPVPLEAYPPMDFIAPAGSVHASARDLARYLAFHQAGLAGRDGILKALSVRRLHTPQGAGRFASGWVVGKGAAGEPVHRHAGTVGASYAEMRLHPTRDVGVLVLTTVARGVGESVANEVARALVRRHAAAAPAGFVSAGAGSSGAGIDLVQGTSTPEQDARVWGAVARMSRALNDEDRAAYRALFAPSFDLRDADSMFDFMARNVLPARGGVDAFHALSPPLEVPGSKLPLRPVVFHLENGYPGYFGFGLDEAGKIAEFSLFVKGDVCPNGSDRACARNSKRLEDLE